MAGNISIEHSRTLTQIYVNARGSNSRRRNPTNWTYTTVPTPSTTRRGYTGHEHLDKFALINMNGRVYDPIIGRFLSPDPYIQAPYFAQNFDRYSYVWNNPLKYVDPSGYKTDISGWKIWPWNWGTRYSNRNYVFVGQQVWLDWNDPFENNAPWQFGLSSGSHGGGAGAPLGGSAASGPGSGGGGGGAAPLDLGGDGGPGGGLRSNSPGGMNSSFSSFNPGPSPKYKSMNTPNGTFFIRDFSVNNTLGFDTNIDFSFSTNSGLKSPSTFNLILDAGSSDYAVYGSSLLDMALVGSKFCGYAGGITFAFSIANNTQDYNNGLLSGNEYAYRTGFDLFGLYFPGAPFAKKGFDYFISSYYEMNKRLNSIDFWRFSYGY